MEPHFSSPAPPCYIGIAQKHPSGKLTEVEFLFLNSGAFRRRFRPKNCSLTLTSLAACFQTGQRVAIRGRSRSWIGDGHAHGPGTAHATGREEKKDGRPSSRPCVALYLPVCRCALAFAPGACKEGGVQLPRGRRAAAGLL